MSTAGRPGSSRWRTCWRRSSGTSTTNTIARSGNLRPPRERRCCRGSLPLSEFNAEYDRELDDTEYTTLGGYLFGQLGRLPRAGDRVSVGDDVFEIVEMEGRRVKTVRYLRGAGATTT